MLLVTLHFQDLVEFLQIICTILSTGYNDLDMFGTETSNQLKHGYLALTDGTKSNYKYNVESAYRPLDNLEITPLSRWWYSQGFR